MATTKYWISIVSKQHVENGIRESICQMCHGKKGPISKLSPGDWLIYYSPRVTMDRKSESVKSFTAIGQIKDDNVYLFKMSENFSAHRRSVSYLPDLKDVEIQPLLDNLSFTKGKGSKWGAIFRRGLFEIDSSDFNLIKSKMVQTNISSLNDRVENNNNDNDNDDNEDDEHLQKKTKKQKINT
ncbi:hypothetical protein CYY_003791 [Polysphondylium violaceum]|uniref:EVE domain-containing protein n=1 Tax=Polysphondylium violaceum TaxID=133409 RepID=A0A8J4PXY0_9MYCE|nr:hypothetical protein CYY_003791 [Polysphondylium violaceum]